MRNVSLSNYDVVIARYVCLVLLLQIIVKLKSMSHFPFRFGVFDTFASWSKLKGGSNDDWADRFSHIYTVIVFAIFAVVISTTQYAGEPIHCWCPAEFKDFYVSYTKQICWISNTYYVAFETPLAVDNVERTEKEITYYQWVPLILAFMAFMFKFPNIIWQMLSIHSGINLDKLVELAEATQMGSPEDRMKSIKHITYFIDRWIDTNKEYKDNAYVRFRQKFSRIFWFLGGNRDGTFLTGLYISVKVLYILNVIGQFFILNGFMGTTYSVYGYQFVRHLIDYGEWKESPRFPRVTLCDFQIRQLQNIQQYTVQCVLPINLFNEKIFIFIWFWLVMIATMAIGTWLVWIYRVFFRRSYVEYVKKFLLVADEISSGAERKLVRKFAESYLRDDGMFILRLIGKNSTDLVTTDLIVQLWKLFKESPGNRTHHPEEFDDEAKEALT